MHLHIIFLFQALYKRVKFRNQARLNFKRRNVFFKVCTKCDERIYCIKFKVRFICILIPNYVFYSSILANTNLQGDANCRLYGGGRGGGGEEGGKGGKAVERKKEGRKEGEG